MNSCPNTRMWLVNRSGEQALFSRARCKSWTCSWCAEINKKQWTARMLFAVLDAEPGEWAMVTLTAHRKERGSVRSHVNIARGWNRLNTKIKRRFPGFMYLRVWEHHKDGSFHAHVLYKPQIKTRWWKDNSAKAGMGHQSKSEDLTGLHALFYVAKYMTKQSKDWPKGTRRIVCSRNFPDRDAAKPRSDWEPIGQDLMFADIFTFTDGLRKEAVDAQTGKMITVDNFL